MPRTTLAHFACELLKIGAVKIDTKKGFRLKLHETNPDAPLSPYYFNLRTAENKGGPLTPWEVNSIAGFFYGRIRRDTIEFQGIAGVPRAGEPFAKALQDMIYHAPGNHSIPLLTLGKEEEESGRKIGKLLRDRDLPRGSQVLVVDDLITKAGSKKEAIDSLQDAGYRVTDILVFLDREQGAETELQKLGIRLHSIVTISSLLKIYGREHLLTAQDLASIRAYMTTN